MKISRKITSRVLQLTAVVNVLAGSAACLAPELNARILLDPEMVLDGQTLRYHIMFWSTVGVLGLGYGAASRDPDGNRGILLAGGLGKIVFSLLALEMLWSGHATVMILGVVSFDAAVGAILLTYLFQIRKGPSAI